MTGVSLYVDASEFLRLARNASEAGDALSALRWHARAGHVLRVLAARELDHERRALVVRAKRSAVVSR